MTTTRFFVEKQATIDPVELTAADAQAAFARGDLTSEALTKPTSIASRSITRVMSL
jgi:hypothetical protein